VLAFCCIALAFGKHPIAYFNMFMCDPLLLQIEGKGMLALLWLFSGILEFIKW